MEVVMKRTPLAAFMSLIILAMAGCGGNSSSAPPPPPNVTQILSDPVYDGDIERDSSGTFTVTQGMTSTVQSVFAGIDPFTGAEYRAFLDFPLTGANGVPGNASIVSAILDIVVNDVILQSSNNTLPIRIELVSIPGLTLFPSDYDRTLQPAITFTTIVPPISLNDAGNHVAIDVTPLMVAAQRLGLLDFQVRILQDFVPAPPGLMEINDTTGDLREQLAPLLQVKYF
jgi:hypothetical protein